MSFPQGHRCTKLWLRKGGFASTSPFSVTDKDSTSSLQPNFALEKEMLGRSGRRRRAPTSKKLGLQAWDTGRHPGMLRSCILQSKRDRALVRPASAPELEHKASAPSLPKRPDSAAAGITARKDARGTEHSCAPDRIREFFVRQSKSAQECASDVSTALPTDLGQLSLLVAERPPARIDAAVRSQSESSGSKSRSSSESRSVANPALWVTNLRRNDFTHFEHVMAGRWNKLGASPNRRIGVDSTGHMSLGSLTPTRLPVKEPRLHYPTRGPMH